MSSLAAASRPRNGDSITIELRRLADGSLVGATESDRWNLQTLAHYCSDLGGRANLDLSKATTRSQLANLRKALAKLGFFLAILSDIVTSHVKPTSKPATQRRPRGASVRPIITPDAS